jgi:hypothetical protein
MSHYNVGVIVNPEAGDPEAEVNRLMEPFNEADENCKEPHWDWYVIGGRWDGSIQGKYRADSHDNGFNFGDEHHKIDFNIVKVKDLLPRGDIPTEVLARMTNKPPGWIPYAIVTPDGRWVDDEVLGEARVLELYRAYPEYNIVSVDMHD